MTDFTKIISQAKELESKMKESQKKIKNIIVEGISGSNSVKVTLNGDGEMIKIYISSETMKCEMGETNAMDGNLTCSGKTGNTVVKAALKIFKNLKNQWGTQTGFNTTDNAVVENGGFVLGQLSLYGNNSNDEVVVKNVNFTNWTTSNISYNLYSILGDDVAEIVTLYKPFIFDFLFFEK